MRSVKQYTQCSPFSPGLKEITILENLLKGWRDVSHKCSFEFQVLHDPSSLLAPLSQTISRFPFLVQPVGTRTKRTIKDFVFIETCFKIYHLLYQFFAWPSIHVVSERISIFQSVSASRKQVSGIHQILPVDPSTLCASIDFALNVTADPLKSLLLQS